jgi:omega-amidase
MDIFIIQPDIAWEDRAANHERARELIKKASPGPGSLVVLPEMFASAFSMNLEATLQGEDREDERFLSELARGYSACVLGGVVSPGEAKRGRNQAVAFGPDGSELVRYTKIHPFSLGGECEAHESGKEVFTFPWGGFKVAPMVCYDLRFPELFREGARQGADLFVVIALWPARRVHHWLTLLRARAIENQAYVIGVNRTGNDPQHQYSGRSVVVDPHGFIIADAGEQEGTRRAQIEPGIVAAWRRDFPALRDAGW